MIILQAIAKSAPRQVSTRYGQKVVIDATAQDGEHITIWRSATDKPAALNSITNGSRIAVEKLNNGKYSLVETPADRLAAIAPTEPDPQPMGFQVEQPVKTSKTAEIAEYVEKLGKLYAHCHNTASVQMAETKLAPAEVKDIATTLFIQTCRHFDL